MICKRCFRLSDDDMNFCPYCGKSFADDDSENGTEHTDGQTDNGTAKETPEEKEPINMWDGPTAYYYADDRVNSAYAQPKPEPSPLSKLFSSMLHAVCYFILFLTVQSVISTGFQMAAMMSASAEYAAQYFEDNGIDVNALSEEEYAEIIENIAFESESVMLEAAYDVDFNLISAVSSVMTVLALLVLAKYKRRTFRDHTSLYFAPLKNPRIWAVIPAAVAMQSIVIFIINIIPFPESVIESYNELYSFIGESPLWIEILAVVVLAPIVEELVFRGCIHTRLRRSMKPLTAALISAFIFGIAHGHLISATYAFILGLVLAYLYEKYDSVIVPILFHAAFNGSNYIPILTPEATAFEFLVTVAVSAMIFAICAVIVVGGPPHKDKNQENDKGI